MSLIHLSTLQSKLDSLQQCLYYIKRHDLNNYTISELKYPKQQIEMLYKYQQQLKSNNNILKYEINSLNKQLSSITIQQPSYDNITRITNTIQLKLLCTSFKYDFEQKQTELNINYHFIGQIIKKKCLSTMTFIELF
eukprot:433985_1